MGGGHAPYTDLLKTIKAAISTTTNNSHSPPEICRPAWSNLAKIVTCTKKKSPVTSQNDLLSHSRLLFKMNCPKRNSVKIVNPNHGMNLRSATPAVAAAMMMPTKITLTRIYRPRSLQRLGCRKTSVGFFIGMVWGSQSRYRFAFPD